MYRFCFTLLLCALPVEGEELLVGRGGLSFIEVQSESDRLSVAADSIWTWDVQPGENLARSALARGGAIIASEVSVDEFGQKLRTIPPIVGLDKMLDGDAGTAFDPDLVELAHAAEIVVDLGGTFHVDNVRFFPRLDSGHRDLFMQAFELGYNRGVEIIPGLNFLDQPFNVLINAHIFSPNRQAIVSWPRANEIIELPEIRYFRLKSLSNLPWEVAEIEINAVGTAPWGIYESTPLEVRHAIPVWGRLQVNGGSPDELPVVVQTRSGPDPEPLHYYVVRRGSLEEVRVDRIFWETLPRLGADIRQADQGPVVPSPDWSAWETVTDGLIYSPPFSYIQFRVRLLEPGTHIDQIGFEFTNRPLAQVLKAEVVPSVASPGEETPFVLHMLVQHLERKAQMGSGFRYLDIRTPAEIVAIDSVRVQDERVIFSVDERPGEGFTVRLLERVKPQASFVQIFFRGKIFFDGTDFQVRAVDIRPTETDREEVHQFARVGDVDERSPGASLAVRLSTRNRPLVDNLLPRSPVITPNNDGINDYLELSYDLLKLTRDAPVSFSMYDLSGSLVRRGNIASVRSGSFVRIWDGRDEWGQRMPPGLYLYQVEVEADAGRVGRQGSVSITY
jgi:hypothetical protein